MRRGEWRAYNQPLVSIQAPKQPIASRREAWLNRAGDRSDSGWPIPRQSIDRRSPV